MQFIAAAVLRNYLSMIENNTEKNMKKLVAGSLYFVLLLLASNVAFAAGKTASASSVATTSKAEIKAESAPVAAVVQTDFPVIFSGTEIFVVSSSPIASLSPENRAKLIQQNIQEFADSKEDTKDLNIIKLPEGLGLGNDDRTLMVLTHQDAEVSGKKPNAFAKEILERIQLTVDNYREKHNWQIYGMGAAFSILSIIALWQAIHWNNRAFKWLTRKVSSLRKYWKTGVHFKEIEVLSAKRIEKLILWLLKILRLFVILLCLYFFLPLTLSFFPETRQLGGRLFQYLLTPFQTIFHTVINFVPNLFYILVIIVIAFYILKLISYVFKLLETGELEFEWFYDDWARPTYQIIRFLVIVTALLCAYP